MDKKGLILVNYPKKPYLLYTITSEDKSDKSIYIGITNNYYERGYTHSKNRTYEKYEKFPLYIWMNDVIDNKHLKVKMKIIEKGYTQEEVFEREKYYISLFRWNNFNVLNIADGGKGFSGKIPWNKGIKNPYSKEQLQRLSKSHKGLEYKGKGFQTQETKELIKQKHKERKENGWVNPRKKVVYKYDISKNLIDTYSCLEDAASANQTHSTSIGEWCRGVKNPKNGFIWSYVLL